MGDLQAHQHRDFADGQGDGAGRSRVVPVPDGRSLFRPGVSAARGQRSLRAAPVPELRRLPAHRRRERYPGRRVRAVRAPAGLAHRPCRAARPGAARPRSLQVVLLARGVGVPGRRAPRPRSAGAGRTAGGALFRQRPGRRARARFARDLGIRGHARRRAAAGEIHPVGGERGDVRALPRLQGRPGPHPFHHEAAEDLKIPDSVYNAWRITSLSTLPSWVLALAVTALAAAVWLSFRGFRTEPAGRRRAALLAFRLMAALLVLVLLLEPGIELRAEPPAARWPVSSSRAMGRTTPSFRKASRRPRPRSCAG